MITGNFLVTQLLIPPFISVVKTKKIIANLVDLNLQILILY